MSTLGDKADIAQKARKRFLRPKGLATFTAAARALFESEGHTFDVSPFHGSTVLLSE